ncbi:MAG: hypothetical protein P4L56_27210 [Candidatus Sulfopaludibacter sp.]|nr:hypothetical protein [Candidatus Sulfopaludibacter sp.]
MICASARCVQLYGWDSQCNAWHGPTEFSLDGARPGHLEKALRQAPGRSWYGPIRCSKSGPQANRFFAVIHALPDSAIAMVYCDESKTGPLELIAAIPADRRALLRPDFAFELVAFASFLGSLGDGAGLSLSEGITAALGESPQSDSLVFSLCTGLWTGDLDYALSSCVEKVATAMLDWLQP